MVIYSIVMILSFVHNANADFIDSFGDAVGESGLGDTLLDINTASVRFDESNLFFKMTFHTPISAPSANELNSVVGVFEFDIDQSNATGNPALQNQFSPPFASLDVGFDFALDLFSETFSPGMVSLRADDSSPVVGNVPITFTPNSFFGQIPLALLGNDDGQVDFTAVIGTVSQPTDALDGVGTSVAVPEPSALVILFTGLAGMMGRRRKTY